MRVERDRGKGEKYREEYIKELIGEESYRELVECVKNYCECLNKWFSPREAHEYDEIAFPSIMDNIYQRARRAARQYIQKEMEMMKEVINLYSSSRK